MNERADCSLHGETQGFWRIHRGDRTLRVPQSAERASDSVKAADTAPWLRRQRPPNERLQGFGEASFLSHQDPA